MGVAINTARDKSIRCKRNSGMHLCKILASFPGSHPAFCTASDEKLDEILSLKYVASMVGGRLGN